MKKNPKKKCNQEAIAAQQRTLHLAAFVRHNLLSFVMQSGRPINKRCGMPPNAVKRVP